MFKIAMKKFLEVIGGIVIISVLLFALLLVINWFFRESKDLKCTGIVTKTNINGVIVSEKPQTIGVEYVIHTGPWYSKTRVSLDVNEHNWGNGYVSYGFTSNEDDRMLFTDRDSVWSMTTFETPNVQSSRFNYKYNRKLQQFKYSEEFIAKSGQYVPDSLVNTSFAGECKPI
jgi:hypothetical protein